MITLKNIKLNNAFSPETPNFTAKVYKDDKLVASISNDGMGGSNNVYPENGLTMKDVQFLASFDMEYEIFRLLDEYELVKKNQTNKIVLKKDG